jgi:hypothetical protein
MRKHFQNKILGIFLSRVSIYSAGPDSRVYRYRCINEIRKTRYIVYRHSREVARERAFDDVISQPPFLQHQRTATWPDSFGRSATVLAIALIAQRPAAAMLTSRIV